MTMNWHMGIIIKNHKYANRFLQGRQSNEDVKMLPIKQPSPSPPPNSLVIYKQSPASQVLKRVEP